MESGSAPSATVSYLIHAVDDHDRRLLENVHPPGWRNPEGSGRYHLVVIGAGTAGLVTAAAAATLGARVALIERGMMGGDCLNVGCVPSKAILAAAAAWRAARDGARHFGAPPAEGPGDFPRVMERMRRLRADISSHDSARRFTELGVDVFFGSASFLSGDRIEVGDRTLSFRRAVIATGTRSAIPAIPGLEGGDFLTHDSVFSLTTRPDRLTVLGAGSTGCELAQAFAAFGSKVTLLERGGRILQHDETDAAELVAGRFARDGIEVLTGANVLEVTRAGGSRVVRYTTPEGGEAHLETDHFLLAAGQVPNVEDLGLEHAGVALESSGVIQVDDRLRTTNPRIFAIGDVASRFRFTHVADAHARIVVRNALFAGREKVSDLVIPWCTYTSPELAHVRRPARFEVVGHDADTVTMPFAEVDRSRLEGETEGFLRVHLRPRSDEILAATVVGAGAGEIIGQIAQAMTTGVGLGRLTGVILPYPTRSEVVRKAADQWRRRKLTPAVARAFRSWFRITGAR